MQFIKYHSCFENCISQKATRNIMVKKKGRGSVNQVSILLFMT